MALEGLTDQFLDLTLGNAYYLPFCPPEDVKRTLKSLNDTPRYLFRVFTPNSSGITDRSWTKAMDARHRAVDHQIDLFARANKRQVADMIYTHLNWYENDSDNLVSWTSSLLFVLVYIFYLRANIRNGSAFENISLCIMDTTCFPTGSFETLRSKKHSSWLGHFYFGEYLSQGALRIEDDCEVANQVVELREKFYVEVADQQGASIDRLKAAISVGELFGGRWRMPMAINLIALVPHGSDDSNIVTTFRSNSFTGMLLTADT
ncbi:hypothetical protein LY78DRAFT_708518 [Colletotrichum sublineola]|nr:hypothetical protein LY78DRAFT_708518 [Colletotrichum sublineola]